MNEPITTGSVVIARMHHDTHRATTNRTWVRMANHEIAPWVSTDDLGNVICMGWGHLKVAEPECGDTTCDDPVCIKDSQAHLPRVSGAGGA